MRTVSAAFDPVPSDIFQLKPVGADYRFPHLASPLTTLSVFQHFVLLVLVFTSETLTGGSFV